MTLTKRKSELTNLTVFDSLSKLREKMFGDYLPNSVDNTRMGHAIFDTYANPDTPPEVKRKIARTVHIYGRYIHTNNIVVPLDEIMEIIDDATDLYVGVCTCRVVEQEKNPDCKCTAPMYACMRMNTCARVAMDGEDRIGLTKEQAKEITLNAWKNGLKMNLESCVQPYQCNICMCCECCCAPMQARFKYELPSFYSGPFVPKYVEGRNDKCESCQSCVRACRLWDGKKALRFEDGKIKVNYKDCLGCGHCWDVCPSGALESEKRPERIFRNVEPTLNRLMTIYTYLYTCRINDLKQFVKDNGSIKHKKLEYPNPDALKPRATDLMDIVKEQARLRVE